MLSHTAQVAALLGCALFALVTGGLAARLSRPARPRGNAAVAPPPRPPTVLLRRNDSADRVVVLPVMPGRRHGATALWRLETTTVLDRALVDPEAAVAKYGQPEDPWAEQAITVFMPHLFAAA